jgi:hypothetical protein
LARSVDHAKSCRVEKGDSFMAVSRPRLLLCLAGALALVGSVGVHAGFGGGSQFRAAHAWLVAPDLIGAVNTVKVADKPAAKKSGFVWSATRIESGIRLRGSVPSDEDRRTLLGMVKAHFPDLEVEDRLKVVKGAPPTDQWLGAVSFGLKQLSHLKRGSARLLDVALKIDGEARSPVDYVEVKKALAGPLPTGLSISSESIRPPVADPFVFVADLDSNALSLSGSVPSESVRKEVRELSRQLFRRPGLDDRLELASGAPKNWAEAVTAALRALSKLESGKIALSGLAVTIEGVAPDKGTAVAVSYQLRRDLPALFSTSESISWKEAAMSQDIAANVISRIKPEIQADDLPKAGLRGLLPLLDSN